jgi:hypothetical protein
MAGLVPAIHVFELEKTWMPGMEPGTTKNVHDPAMKFAVSARGA